MLCDKNKNFAFNDSISYCIVVNDLYSWGNKQTSHLKVKLFEVKNRQEYHNPAPQKNESDVN